MLLDSILGFLVEFWWVVALVVLLGLLNALLIRKHSRRRRLENTKNTLMGKAYVTDGDGVRVDGAEVRIFGIDAPEWDQRAKHREGYWFNHGKIVKSALIEEIGGKYVRVVVEDIDKFGRLLGTVTCGDRDIGAWLVQEGHAIAAYSDRYKRDEQEARIAKRGMWAHAYNFDPRAHRHRSQRQY